MVKKNRASVSSISSFRVVIERRQDWMEDSNHLPRVVGCWR